MTQAEMIAYVRRLISDEQATGFPENDTLEDPDGTDELLFYLDKAVYDYSLKLADAKNPRLIKRMNVFDGAALPEDFLVFCGAVPVNIEGGVISYYGEDDMQVKYFARLPLVTSYASTDTLPYNNDECIKIASLGAIYAQNKHNYNVSQDLSLFANGVMNNANTTKQAQQR